MPELPRLAVVNYVREADHDALLELLRADGFCAFELSGVGVHDKATFLAAADRILGGEPLGRWSTFEDRFRELISEERSCLVWTAADQMLDHGLGDLVSALDVLTDIAREVYAHGRVFATFLLGDGDNFPPLPSKL